MSVPCIEGTWWLYAGEETGMCPWCWRDVSLTARGRLHRHIEEPGVRCYGSGRFPAPASPRVVTVRTGGGFL